MKTALLFALIPCLALGRVGERIEDFVKRSESKPINELKLAGNVFYCDFLIDDIVIEIYGRDGVIFREVYRDIKKDKADAISEKQPKTFKAPLRPGQDWRDENMRVSIYYFSETLWVQTREGERLKELVDAEKKRIGTPKKKPNVDKF